MSHMFRGDKWSFLKVKTVRKGPSKQKLRADIRKMLHDLKDPNVSDDLQQQSLG
jgi:hypothetical protein